jgi:hypothetical protein
LDMAQGHSDNHLMYVRIKMAISAIQIWAITALKLVP